MLYNARWKQTVGLTDVLWPFCSIATSGRIIDVTVSGIFDFFINRKLQWCPTKPIIECKLSLPTNRHAAVKFIIPWRELGYQKIIQITYSS